MLVFAPAVSASFFDDFDSYANTDEMDDVTPSVVGPWVQIYPTAPFDLDTSKGYSQGNFPGNCVHPAGPDANSENRMYQNFEGYGAEYVGTDANPITFSIMIQLGADNDWWTREYVEVRGYTGHGYADGDLQELIALGVTSSGDTTTYDSRTLTGNNWEDMQPLKTTDWVKLTAEIKTSQVDYYYQTLVDPIGDPTGALNPPVFSHSSARTPGVTLDCVVVGSGLSTRTDVWFDDVLVTPEPASLALLVLGGLALIRRR
jgi:hypothetical protein